jgi:hypothetical protein
MTFGKNAALGSIVLLAGWGIAGQPAQERSTAENAETGRKDVARRDDFGLWLPRNVQAFGWTLNFSGEERAREEWWNNADLNEHVDDRDGRFFLRTRLKAEALFQKTFRAVVELVDGREWESDRHPRPQNDELDLHQAFVQFGTEPVMLRLGRQELDFGSRRLVAAPTWNNLLRSFDAARVSYTSKILDIHAFLGSVVVPVDDHFNRHKDGEILYGLFSTLKPLKGHKLDLYALGFQSRNEDLHVTGEDKAKGDHDRYTLGTRLYGNITKNWTYDTEAAYQFGRYAHDRIRAWAFHADTAYTFGLPWNPTIQPLFNYASGDKNPTDGRRGTFDPLFTTTHGMYGGSMDFVTWMNIKVVGARFKVNPVKKLTLTLEAHRYWLAEDGWYLGTKRATRRDKTGRSGGSVGHELGLVAKYTVNKQLDIEGGIARFFAGRFAERTGPDDNADFAYLQTLFKF